MKKNLFLSATALVGMMSMVSCSSEDEMKPQNGKREEVKTSFTLSVGSVKPGTRMTAEAVQQDEDFNGMGQIQLFPFSNTGELDGDEPITNAPIHLADFNKLDKVGGQAKVYNDVVVPVGVNNFVFYGMSQEKGIGDLAASYDSKALTSTSTLSNDVYFDLVSWNPDKTYTDFNNGDERAKQVLAAINAVSAELDNQVTNTLGLNAQLNTVQKALRKMEAGSSNSVRLFLQDVYDRLIGINTTESNAVCGVFTTYFTISGDEETGYTLDWIGDPQFPGKYNLPDGAVALKFNDVSKKFEYWAKSVDGLAITDVKNYMKPACLAYFVNTPAMTKNETYVESSRDTKWEDVITNGVYTTDPVSLTTQSVILKKQIQYAVGRLDAQVKIDDVTLKDNGEGPADSDDQIVIAPADGYKLTGVLIGGQKQVDWKFQPRVGTEYTIYDNNMTTETSAKVGLYSDINHTLALETSDGTPVNVCFEFVNSGKDFFGKDNMIIPAGSKFYLVARLTPGTSSVVNNPNSKNQVFLQDYITTAKLTIGANSLKNAYNVVPDLRSPKLELGLSVDLEWQEGITFEQDF